MRQSIRLILVISVLVVVATMTGCFARGGFNPVADNSLAQNQLSANIAPTANPAIQACKYKAPTSNKKYTFAAPAHEICHKMRAGLAPAKGCLKISVQSASKADHIYITIDQVRVKKVGANGKNKFKELSLPAREIDLLQATDISQVLADLALEPGVYNHMEFRIAKVRMVVGGVEEKLFVMDPRANCWWRFDRSYNVYFRGNFEIKDGFRTELAVKFIHKSVKIRVWGKNYHWWVPMVKISYQLVPIQPPVVTTDGDVTLAVTDFVKKVPISGVNALLEGTSFSGNTDGNGALSFNKVPAGTYNMKLAHPNFLDKTFSVVITAGQVAEAKADMNPAVIVSNTANTGWFSELYPFADANGTYGELAMETPVTIDFVSLAFTKVEVAFDAEFQEFAAGDLNAFINISQQVTPLQTLDGWWVGNNAALGSSLGRFTATNPATRYVVNVTDFVRSNPNATYFFAAQNLGLVNIRMNNVLMTINYR